MHYTAKKTTRLIIEGGNDYVITVKGNQSRLLKQLKTITKTQKPCERVVEIEKNRGRTTCKIISIFIDLRGIDLYWVGLRSLIQVERIGIRSGEKYVQGVQPGYVQNRTRCKVILSQSLKRLF
jgi:hypothetical protein